MSKGYADQQSDSVLRRRRFVADKVIALKDKEDRDARFVDSLRSILEAPLQGQSNAIAALNYQIVSTDEKYKESIAWKERKEPPLTLVKNATSTPENYQKTDIVLPDSELWKNRDYKLTIDIEGQLEQLQEFVDALQPLAGRHVADSLRQAPTMEQMFDIQRDLFTWDVTTSDSSPCLIVPPPLGTGAIHESHDEAMIGCVLILVNDLGTQPQFRYVLDEEWQAWMDASKTDDGSPDSIHLAGLMSRAIWSGAPPDKEPEWVSDKCYRYRRPFVQYNYQPVVNQQQVLDAERLFIKPGSTVYQVPIFGNKRMIGIIAFLGPAGEKTWLAEYRNRGFLFDAVRRSSLALRELFYIGRAEDIGELAWFIRHNLGNTYTIPALRDLAMLSQDLDGENRIRVDAVMRRIRSIDAAIDSMLPLPGKTAKVSLSSVPLFDLAEEFLQTTATTMIAEAKLGGLVELFLAHGDEEPDLVSVPGEILELALSVLIGNAIRAYKELGQLVPADPEDPERITLEIKTTDDRKLCLRCYDAGIGMEGWRKDLLNGLFAQIGIGLAPRITPTLVRTVSGWKGSGTGIGILSTARSLAPYGAAFRIEYSCRFEDADREDRGSIVALELPYVQT